MISEFLIIYVPTGSFIRDIDNLHPLIFMTSSEANNYLNYIFKANNKVKAYTKQLEYTKNDFVIIERKK